MRERGREEGQGQKNKKEKSGWHTGVAMALEMIS